MVPQVRSVKGEIADQLSVEQSVQGQHPVLGKNTELRELSCRFDNMAVLATR